MSATGVAAMGEYSIKDLEKLSRVKAHTIRIWEKRYGLLKPQRSDTNIRTYSDDDLKKILNVSVLNSNGVKISHIAKLKDDEIGARVLELESAESGHVNQIENLIIAMTDLDEDRFEKIIANSIIRCGFESTMLDVVHPFLKQVGVLWQVGKVKPGQEHFISNLIRQKLIAAIDSHGADRKKQCKTFMLFLPEHELHELGLLFAWYLIKKHGHECVYLGQSVPFKDLVAVATQRDPQYLMCSFLAGMNEVKANALISKLSTTFKDQEILFLKNSWLADTHKWSNVSVLDDMPAFRDLLESL